VNTAIKKIIVAALPAVELGEGSNIDFKDPSRSRSSESELRSTESTRTSLM
jgi:hypothetical protein